MKITYVAVGTKYIIDYSLLKIYVLYYNHFNFLRTKITQGWVYQLNQRKLTRIRMNIWGSGPNHQLIYEYGTLLEEANAT